MKRIKNGEAMVRNKENGEKRTLLLHFKSEYFRSCS